MDDIANHISILVQKVQIKTPYQSQCTFIIRQLTQKTTLALLTDLQLCCFLLLLPLPLQAFLLRIVTTMLLLLLRGKVLTSVTVHKKCVFPTLKRPHSLNTTLCS